MLFLLLNTKTKCFNSSQLLCDTATACNTPPDTCRLQLVLPDVDAAEQPEQQPQDEGQRDGQQRAEQPVEEELDQLKGGMAADPHPVEAVRGDGLGDDVLEADLRRQEERKRERE